MDKCRYFKLKPLKQESNKIYVKFKNSKDDKNRMLT